MTTTAGRCRTGRSRPGRDLVLRLADVLTVPVRERNALLAAAGLAPVHADLELDSDVMASVRAVLDRVLSTHEPYPAWVIGRGLRFLAANRGAERLFPGMTGLSPAGIIDAWFGPGPFRERVVNWPVVVGATLASLRREALLTGDAEVFALLRRAEGLLAATTLSPPADGDGPPSPVACPILDLGGQQVRTISTVMRFDTATEVTTSELRVELMYPADEASAAVLRSWESHSGRGGRA